MEDIPGFDKILIWQQRKFARKANVMEEVHFFGGAGVSLA